VGACFSGGKNRPLGRLEKEDKESSRASRKTSVTTVVRRNRKTASRPGIRQGIWVPRKQTPGEIFNSPDQSQERRERGSSSRGKGKVKTPPYQEPTEKGGKTY